MSSPVDAGFVMKVWLALDEMRAAESRVISGYLSRLGGFAETLYRLPYFSSTDRPSSSRPIAPWRASLWQKIKQLCEIVALAPALIQQMIRLRKIKRSKPACVTVLAIPSSRLPLDPRAASVVDNLAYIVKPLSGSGGSELAAKIAASESILLFDPLPVSSYWSHRRQCSIENIVIVDGTFLLALALSALLRRPGSMLRRLLELRRQCRAVCPAAKSEVGWRALWCALLALAYNEALEGFGDIQAMFFTSNSTLTELLRAYLVQNAACQHVYDVMHGVGSEQAERFYSDLLRDGRERGISTEYRFIPQIPNLPLFGVFKQRAMNHDAINAHLNRFLFACTAGGASLEAFVESEGRSIWGDHWQSANPLVVTILGTFEDDFFHSSSFKAECLLIAMARESVKALGIESTLLYVPHPLTGMRELSHPVFAAHQVRLCRYAVYSWLVSDLCVSLISSAMFEATYFGSDAFTPMTERDGLYTPYLGLVGHARSESLDDTVRDFRATFGKRAASPRVSLRQKAAQRLVRMR